MGNDGGSIPKRTDLVKLSAREAYTKELDAATSTDSLTYCALSKRPLSSPLVSCALGRLYNKDAVLEYLISPETCSFGDADITIPHVKNIKDVVVLKLTENSEWDEDKMNAKWTCPVTRREMNVGGKFVYLAGCGDVFSKDAVDTIESDECLQCGSKFEKQDVIPINPSKTDLPALKARMEKLESKGITHSLVPAKKSKKRKADKQDQHVLTIKRINTAPEVKSGTVAGDLARRVGVDVKVKEQSDAIKSLYATKKTIKAGNGFLN
ncbi:Protein RTF2 [Neolecta irregularis DAH-3]|uniref:Protein RTF2 n=1 Tax=Neolecta irregularis (strain DAH-3) TaxID=1198029 RepID=A0A1U7LUW9_NEOID|nr:Protein RTF2 [Neolecta irregularis DAH-3]|eukprot:OLL26311.1 Protein RTF2 [Neolecta irregularis DAH-3]